VFVFVNLTSVVQDEHSGCSAGHYAQQEHRREQQLKVKGKGRWVSILCINFELPVHFKVQSVSTHRLGIHFCMVLLSRRVENYWRGRGKILYRLFRRNESRADRVRPTGPGKRLVGCGLKVKRTERPLDIRLMLKVTFLYFFWEIYPCVSLPFPLSRRKSSSTIVGSFSLQLVFVHPRL
jgi:hypothetical protein